MRYKMTRADYVPEGAKEIKDDAAKAVIYTYEDQQGKPYALGFGGKRQKPDFHHRFLSKQQRTDHINKYLNGLREHLTWKAEQRAKKKAFTTSLKAGDIMYTSWGYEQTNVDWFQVIEVKPSGKTIVIREIAGNLETDSGCGPMSGRTAPVKGKFVGEPMTKRVQQGDSVKIHQSAYAYKWDGKPRYTSWCITRIQTETSGE